jgi:nucleotide-binding universal stress UspA family protein
MKNYKKILCPVDGSPLSDLAFDRALGLVKLIQGSLTVVHVIEPIALNYSGFEEADMVSSLGLIESESIKSVKRMLEGYSKSAESEGVEIETKILHGSIAHEIVQLSSEYDLVIMGTQGRNMLSSLFLGSVAEKVARHACCPVTLVRKLKKDCHKHLAEN